MKKKTIKSTILLGAIFVLIIFASCKALPEKPSDRPYTEVSEPSSAEQEQILLSRLYEASNKGDLQAASDIIEQLIALAPESILYPVLKASLLLSSGYIQEAKKCIDSVLELHPDNIDALITKAEIERFSGNSKGRVQALETVLKLDPLNTEANAAIGSVYYDNKNYSKAEESFNKALNSKADNPEALLGLARVKVRRNDDKAALALIDKAVAIAPDDALAYLDRSRVLYRFGRYAESEADLSKSISLAPGSSWAYVERGRLYMDTGRMEAAKMDLDKSIKLDPDYFLPYIYRAAIFEKENQDEAAFADYKSAISLYPDYWYSFESMAVLAWRLGRWVEAYNAFDKASSYTDSHPEYYIAAALCLMKNGDTKTAKAYAEKKLTKISRDKFPAHWLALRLIFDQNDMSNEFEQRINSEKKLDTKAGLLFYLGSYWEARGRSALALKYIKLSLEYKRIGSPEYRMAEAELARLEANN